MYLDGVGYSIRDSRRDFSICIFILLEPLQQACTIIFDSEFLKGNYIFSKLLSVLTLGKITMQLKFVVCNFCLLIL